MGLCLWSRSRSGLGYVCVCGFVLVVRIGWLNAWFGLALLWAVVVGYDSGVMAGFGMILGDSFWLWDGFCGGFDSRCYVVVLVSLVVVVEGCGGGRTTVHWCYNVLCFIFIFVSNFLILLR